MKDDATQGRSTRRLEVFSEKGLLRLVQAGFQGTASCDDVPGLILYFGKMKTTWRFRFRPPSSPSPTTVTLGQWPKTSIAEAASAAGHHRQLLERGEDPRRVHHMRRDATLGEVLDAWLHASPSPEHRKQASRIRRRTAVLLDRRVRSLTDTDVLAVLRSNDAVAGPSEVSNLDQNLRTVLHWAVSRGYLDRSPVQATPKRKSPPRSRYPRLDELQAALAAADELPAHLGDFLKCSVLLAARTGELDALRIMDVHLDRAHILIPAEASKSRKAFIIITPPPVIDILKRRIGGRTKGGERVFTGERGGRMRPDGVAEIHRFMNETLGTDASNQLRLHDNRRAIASVLLSHGFSRDVAHAALRHTLEADRGRTALDHTYSLFKMTGRVVRPACLFAGACLGASPETVAEWEKETLRRLGSMAE